MYAAVTVADPWKDLCVYAMMTSHHSATASEDTLQCKQTNVLYRLPRGARREGDLQVERAVPSPVRIRGHDADTPLIARRY